MILVNKLKEKNESGKRALTLIFLFGIISFLGDIIYEGARSVNGPYLQLVGANATAVGFIVGIGEFLGYLLRLISGYFADKKKLYWFFVIFGYSLLISVPLLSFTGRWQLVALLIILERIGKGIRTPARDTIVSYGAKRVGTGLGFGIAEFIDQIGAIVGPLVFTFLFVRLGSVTNQLSTYQQGYRLLLIPFVFLMVVLFITFMKFRKPDELEQTSNKKINLSITQKIFWLYSLFIFLTTTGFVNFAILGFHLKQQKIIADQYIPFLYALAMGIDALAGIGVGKLYDSFKEKEKNQQAGLKILILAPLLSIFIPLFVFSRNLWLIFSGVFGWGLVMGIHETIMRSGVADITPPQKRATSFGIFNIWYGLAFFLGGYISGILYDYSLPAMINALIAIQIISLPVFYLLKNKVEKFSFFISQKA